VKKEIVRKISTKLCVSILNLTRVMRSDDKRKILKKAKKKNGNNVQHET